MNQLSDTEMLTLCGVFFIAILMFATPAHAASSLLYTFNSPGTLYEAGSSSDSTSPYWWVNSGGAMPIVSGTGETIQGSLPSTNKWRLIYATANPVDTDNGYHPQNIFRLVSKDTWANAAVQSTFYIAADNMSSSPNRNQSNGLLLFNRYQPDGQTLYYAGIRVDGTAILKKKYHGTYYTMAQKQIFPGNYTIASQTNLLPHNQWLSLKSTTVTNADGSVTVRLYMKGASESTWTELVNATDTGRNYGGTPVIESGSSGIRTDFMDVKFDNFRVDPL